MLKTVIPYGLLVIVLLGGGWYSSTQNNKIKDLEEAVETRDLQIDIYETNVELLENQLAFEAQNEENGNVAIQELKEVPQEEFDRPLSPSVQGVLDRFHSSIRP